MFAIIEYMGKILNHLRKDPLNYDHILKLLGGTEDRSWNKIRRMKSHVDLCPYFRRERCEVCRILLEEGGEER